jgi:hypothetical protein
MNKFSKIILLNEQLIQLKFEKFFDENKNEEKHFNRKKFYEFILLDSNQYFSIYIEYLSFVKHKLDEQLH